MATFEAPGMVGKGKQRFAARRQVETVLHLLRGEDLEWVSRE